MFMEKFCNLVVTLRGKMCHWLVPLLRDIINAFCRNAAAGTFDYDGDSEEPVLGSKNDIVEPVVFKGGSMTAEARNALYIDHNLPGIGRRKVETEEEKKEKKVILVH